MAGSPIDQATRDRFLREIVENSGPDGIDPQQLEDALAAFIHMQIDAAAISLWTKGELGFGWGDEGMVWHLIKPSPGAAS